MYSVEVQDPRPPCLLCYCYSTLSLTGHFQGPPLSSLCSLLGIFISWILAELVRCQLTWFFHGELFPDHSLSHQLLPTTVYYGLLFSRIALLFNRYLFSTNSMLCTVLFLWRHQCVVGKIPALMEVWSYAQLRWNCVYHMRSMFSI